MQTDHTHARAHTRAREMGILHRPGYNPSAPKIHSGLPIKLATKLHANRQRDTTPVIPLVFSGNRIGDDGFRQLVRSLHSLPNLRELDASSNEITAVGLAALAAELSARSAPEVPLQVRTGLTEMGNTHTHTCIHLQTGLRTKSGGTHAALTCEKSGFHEYSYLVNVFEFSSPKLKLSTRSDPSGRVDLLPKCNPALAKSVGLRPLTILKPNVKYGHLSARRQSSLFWAPLKGTRVNWPVVLSAFSTPGMPRVIFYSDAGAVGAELQHVGIRVHGFAGGRRLETAAAGAPRPLRLRTQQEAVPSAQDSTH